MKEYKVKVTALTDGRIVVDGLPVTKGEQVEVTIRMEEKVPLSYPLRGLPVQYHEPFEPAVDEQEWDATK